MSYSFATSLATIKQSDAPDKCPICGYATKINLYSVDCLNDWNICQWYEDFEDEKELEKPDTYDWVINK
jgi:hypothetical protein